MTRALRQLYAAPGTEQYWRELEARIVARIAADGAAGEALVAAALPLGARRAPPRPPIALLVAGVALWREREVREQSAIETVLLQANPPLSQLAAAAGTAPDSEAVLRYILTP